MLGPTSVKTTTEDISIFKKGAGDKPFYIGQGQDIPEGFGTEQFKDEATTSPITTSEPATSPLEGIEDDIIKTEEEITKSEDRYKSDQEKRDRAYEQQQKNIELNTKKRLRGQEQTGKAIVSESRAMLAELGILSTEPGVVSGTPAMQYLNDVAVENQKEMDSIRAEELEFLQAAKDAKDAGDTELSNKNIDQLQSLRAERNKIRMDAAQEAREIRQAERDEDTAKIQEAIEARAEKKFNREKAFDTLDILSKSGIDELAEYAPSDWAELERATGLKQNILIETVRYMSRQRGLEGWSHSFQNNPNTGETFAVGVRTNPDTGELETEKLSMGFIGDRWKATGGDEVDETEKFDDDDRKIIIGLGFSNSEINQIESDIAEFGLDKTLSGMEDEKANSIKKLFEDDEEGLSEEDLTSALEEMNTPWWKKIF